MVAAAIGVAAAASVAAGAMSSSAAGAAAGQQAGATKLGIEQQQAMYGQNTAILNPYSEYGQNAVALATQLLPQTTNNPVPQLNEQTLQNTPGYQFELQNGLQATQNSAAARGLGVSGAAMKAAGTYATGLADSTWQNVWGQQQQQYQDQLASNQNAYNQLMGIGQLGMAAGSALAGVGQSTANQVSSGFNNIGQAQAAGTVGSANAMSGGLTSATGSIGSYALYNQLMNGNNVNPSSFPSTNEQWYSG